MDAEIADILDGAEAFEEFTGRAPTHVMMNRELADRLGVRGEPVRQVPVDVNGIHWWATLPPKTTP